MVFGYLSLTGARERTFNLMEAQMQESVVSIKFDPTIYEIKISHGNHEDLSQIKAMSKVSRRSILDSRKLLKTDHPTAFKGDAVHAIEARDVLLAADLEIEFSPAFPW